MSQQAKWRRFVERRRRELHDVYPCAMPTQRRLCPRHDIPIPQELHVPAGYGQRPDGSWGHVRAHTLQLSGICKPCRDELYEQLAAEYVAASDPQPEKPREDPPEPVGGQMDIYEVLDLVEQENAAYERQKQKGEAA